MAAFDRINAWWSDSGKSLSVLAIMLSLAVPAVRAQSGGQTSSQQTAQQPAQQPANSQPAQDIPDAPSTVQPPAPKIPASTPDNPKKPDENPFPADAPRLPQTQSREQSAQPDQQTDQDKARPMPAVVTVPPGSGPRNLINPGFTIRTSVNLVLIPAMVKDSDGRRVDGLLPKDFTVLENGQKQPLTFFTSDPFQLSVAIVLDTGMADVALQKVNQTYSALVGAFSAYDEVALYTYSSTVSQVSDFSGRPEKLTAVLNQMKFVRGAPQKRDRT